MTQEIIDVVVKSAGTKRVVRDIDDIADAAINAGRKLKDLQNTLNKLAGGGLISQLSRLQNQLSQLGQNAHLNNLLNQLQQVNRQMGQLRAGTGHAHNGFNLLGNSALGTLRRIEHAASAVVAALGIRKLMDWADAWISAAGKVNIFARSQDEANVIMERLFKIAQNVRQPLTNIVDLYHRLTVSQSELGASQNQMLKVTEIVGQSLAVQGTTATKARGALLQLSQAFAQSRVRGQEFNSILDGMPILLKLAAKHIDGAAGSTAKLRQMMLAGKLSNTILFNAILKSATEMEELFQRAPKTFSQAFTVLTNAVERYLGKMNENLGISTKFFALTKFIADNLDTIGKLLFVVASGFAAAFVPTAIAGVVTGLRAALPLLGSMVAILNANPFAVLATAAAAAYAFGDAIVVGNDGITTLQDLFNVLAPTVTSFFTGAWSLAKQVFEGILDFGIIVYDQLTKRTSDASTAWKGSYSEFFNDVGTGFQGFVVGLAKTADAIGGLIIGLGIGVVRVFEGLPGAIAEIGKRMYNSFIPHIENMVNGVIEGFNKVRSFFGLEQFSLLSLKQVQVDEGYFKNYGARIADSIDEGFATQDNFLSSRVRKIFDEANKLAQARRAAATAANGIATDLDAAPLGGGATPDGKHKKAPVDRTDAINASRIRELLAPARELTKHAERDLQLMELNTAQHLEQLRAKANMNKLSERDQFIQQEMLRLTDKYEDKISKIKETMKEMRENGVLEDVLNPDVQKQWDDLGNTLYNLENSLAKLKKEAPEQIGRIFDSMKLDKFADDLNKSVAEALISAGRGGAKGIRDAIASELKKPFVTVIQAFIRPFTDAIANFAGSFMGGGNGFSGFSLGNLSNFFNSGGGGTPPNPFVTGSGSGGSSGFGFPSFGFGGFGGGGSFMGPPSPFGVSGFGTGLQNAGNVQFIGDAFSAGNFAQGAGAAMPYVGALYAASQGKWGTAAGTAIGAAVGGPVGAIVGSAIGSLADSLFGGGGGPKSEIGYGYGIHRTPNSDQGRQITDSIQAEYENAVKSFGIKPSQLDLGYFSATDPQGDAMTQLSVNAALNGRSIYSRDARLGGNENVGRGEDDLKNAIAEETRRVVLGALQASEIAGPIGDYLRSLGDLAKLTGQEIEKTINRVTKAAEERRVLEDREFELTHTQAEILARDRGRELDAVDELNKTLVQRVHALEDERKAADVLQTALAAARDSSRAFSDFMRGVNGNIRGYLDGLDAGQNSIYSPAQRLSNAQRQFDAQIGLARSGDREALQGITSYADQLITASRDAQGNGAETAAIVERVKAALRSLPGYESGEQYLARIIKEAIAGQTVDLKDSLSSNFQMIDTSLDGALNLEELKAYFGPLATDETLLALMAVVDTNGDGQITQMELLASTLSATTVAVGDKLWEGLWGSAGLLAQNFAAIDANLSGALDFSELKAALGPLATDQTIRDLIAKADANSDGQIDKQEAIRTAIITASLYEANKISSAVAGVPPKAELFPGGNIAPSGGFFPGVAPEDIMVDGGSGTFYNRQTGQIILAGYQGPLAANGGIFGNGGFDSLPGYRYGGIVSEPTVMVGEGQYEEAIVPLPNGRFIDAHITGGQSNDEVVAEIQELRAQVQVLIDVTAAGARGAHARLEKVAENTKASAQAAGLAATRAPVGVVST